MTDSFLAVACGAIVLALLGIARSVAAGVDELRRSNDLHQRDAELAERERAKWESASGDDSEPTDLPEGTDTSTFEENL